MSSARGAPKPKVTGSPAQSVSCDQVLFFLLPVSVSETIDVEEDGVEKPDDSEEEEEFMLVKGNGDKAGRRGQGWEGAKEWRGVEGVWLPWELQD